MAKREKSKKYTGVYFRVIDEVTKERMYYIMYRQGGRGSKLIEEPVGKSGAGMTEAKASHIRGDRMRGKENSNTTQRRILEAEKQAEQSNQSLDQIWEKYQEANPQHKGRATDISRYNTYLKKPLGKKTIDNILTADVDRLQNKALREGKSPATIKNILALLSAIINFGVDKGHCKRPDPDTLKIKKPKVNNEKTEILSDEQLKNLLQALDEEEDQNAAALMRLALQTGMRKGALIGLCWNDCDFQNDVICLRGEYAKNGETSYIPMTSSVKEILLNISRTDSPFIFPGRDGKKRTDYRRIARRVKKKAGLPDDFRPLHGLRHNFASRLASSGKVSLYTLQKLLTHSSPQMTQRYAHLTNEALKEAAKLSDSWLTETKEEESEK